MRYKVNPLSENELRVRARNQFSIQEHSASSDSMDVTVPHLLEDLAISKIELEMQNEHLQDTRAKLELALRQHAELFDFSPVGFFRVDTKGVIIKSNLVGANMLGVERAKLRGHAFDEFFQLDQREQIHAIQERGALTGDNQRCELTLLEAIVSPRHVQVDLAPLAPSDGYLLTLIDISERKRLEHQLRDDEQRWKFALDTAGDGFWDWNVHDGSVHYSSKLIQLYGYSANEFGGTLSSWRALVHTEDQADFLIAMQSCLTGRTPNFSIEQRVRCKNGTWKWILCRGAVFSVARGGAAERLIGTHVDITARKQIEIHFRDISGMQQAAFDSLPNRVAVLDRSGLLLHTNAAWDAYLMELINGHTAEGGFIGMHYERLIGSLLGSSPDLEQEALEGIAEVISGLRLGYQLEYAHSSDTIERWFRMDVTSVREGLARAVVSHQDITRIHKDLGQTLDNAHFHRVAQAEFYRAVRYQNPLMVLVLRLDQSADAATRDVLQHSLARITQGVLRSSDILGQIGGDTYALILPNTTLEGGETLAMRIVAGVSASPIGAGGREVLTTASVGGCQLVAEDTFPAVLTRAKEALQLARSRGGVGVVMDSSGCPCLW